MSTAIEYPASSRSPGTREAIQRAIDRVIHGSPGLRLLGSGTNARGIDVQDLARRLGNWKLPLRLSLVGGVGRLDARDMESAVHGFAMASQFALRVTPSLAVALDAATLFLTDDIAAQSVLVGARWSPFRTLTDGPRPSFGAVELSLFGAIGYSFVDRTDSESNVHGLGAALAIQWLPVQGDRLAFGLELADRVTLAGSLRHVASVSTVIQVRQSWPF